ncbi:MAG: ExbD/TolR family protein [Alphaproteobacteria bacterium]
MKITRLRVNKKGKIEIIPMIDVMFFLLATFIIASLSMQYYQGIAVNLSQGQAEKISQEQTITISITKDNLVYVNKNKVELTNLVDEINRLYPQQDLSEKIILLACDKDSKQGIATQVMLLISKVGGQHFSIITQP